VAGRAGHYAIYLALTAIVGQPNIADTYLDLDGQHAEEADCRRLETFALMPELACM